jgi:hypothetical protein
MPRLLAGNLQARPQIRLLTTFSVTILLFILYKRPPMQIRYENYLVYTAAFRQTLGRCVTPSNVKLGD